jgi:hypothetical protein
MAGAVAVELVPSISSAGWQTLILTSAIGMWPSMVLCRVVDNTLDCRKRMFWPATPIHRHSWRGHIRSPMQRISPPCSLEPVAPAQRDFRDNASCDIRSEQWLWTHRRSQPGLLAKCEPTADYVVLLMAR